MGTFSKAVLWGSVGFFGLVLVKDGTAPKLVTNISQGVNDLIGGLKPITTLA
jgi:hypothetical protein